MLGYEYFYLTKNQTLQTFKNNKILYYWAQKLSKYLVSYKGRNQFIISSFIIYRISKKYGNSIKISEVISSNIFLYKILYTVLLTKLLTNY